MGTAWALEHRTLGGAQLALGIQSGWTIRPLGWETPRVLDKEEDIMDVIWIC